MLLRSTPQPRRGTGATSELATGATGSTIAFHPTVSDATSAAKRTAGLATHPPCRSLHPLRTGHVPATLSASAAPAPASSVHHPTADVPTGLALALAAANAPTSAVSSASQRTAAALSAVPSSVAAQASTSSIEPTAHAIDPAHT